MKMETELELERGTSGVRDVDALCLVVRDFNLDLLLSFTNCFSILNLYTKA